MALIDNLISYWKLDETSGTRADSHGSNDLTDNNTVGSATGIINNGADFESTNSEFLSITDAAQSGLDLGAGGTDFSISFWFNAESLPSSGQYRTWFWKWVGGTNNRQYVIDLTNASGTYKSSILLSSTGSAGAYSSEVNFSTSFSTATWYHFVYVYDASAGELKAYVNASLEVTHTGTPTSIFDGNGDFKVGAGQGYIDGVLDEVGVWDRTLDTTEISSLYNGGSALAYPFTSSVNSNFFAFM